ncbi:FKBP-type peptidyl-prolyl cis-trans isomerase [Rubrivirga sp. S365]|uniref:Peptidyl-prolyl cis-trans isomerase n=1 Tax=Rubrivirga litoralis TaxID=3075598 RepID=A0ABU3BTE1_9BACT|nr:MULTISPECIES: FKBP-type peptidyl-prolyl cis-trans isomerase [unclassified Rubrivirga]MDT0632563.1 FKBP-type peptidyl-prolyl cis-trans isomerase [Rubrivirga sp. F394]MDT7856749.1 FKBP-type peptidyl-prolyl cis-trans isomerase [Rubrivirga sp. S365]
MTLRSPLCALALAAALVGCGEGTASSSPAAGTTDLDNLAGADPVAQIAYDAGFQAAGQLRGQDSTLQFSSFEDGFNTGLRNARDPAYAEGVQFGLQVGADTVVNIDPEVFLAGAREAFEGAESRLTPEQLQAAQAAAQDSIQMRQLRSQARSNPQARERLDQLAQNRTQADAFLAQVAERPGIQRLPSGVLYTITDEGEGAKPTVQSVVSVDYTGRLADGTVFDQSPEGQPVQFPVGNVVPGFRDAILDMRPGETRTVYLPPDLAYGQAGAPGPGGQGGIPPNAALEFDITLREVLNAPPQGAGGAVPPLN